MDLFGASSLVLFAAIVGLNQVLVKLVNAGMSPLMQAGLRSALALPLVLFWAIGTGRWTLPRAALWPGLAAGVFFSLEYVFLFNGLALTSVARGSLVFYSMPCWVALGAHQLIPGERLSPLRLTGLALAFGGVALVMMARAGGTGGSLTGDTLCLGAALSWAALTLITRTTALGRATPEAQLSLQLLVSALLILPAALGAGPAFRQMTPSIAAIFAFQVVVVATFSFVGWFWFLQRYRASDVAAFGLLSPVFAFGFATIILGEAPHLVLMLALVLIISGLFLVTRSAGDGGRV
jgi:drug/metabolite transporter (DMT)-like permease